MSIVLMALGSMSWTIAFVLYFQGGKTEKVISLQLDAGLFFLMAIAVKLILNL